MAETIYILTNDSMPGLVKIGLTATSVEQRIRELDSTGVPLPFRCYYAARVNDGKKAEHGLHIAFGDFRVRQSREFFRVDPFRVKAALDLAALEDVTPKGEIIQEAADTEALVASNAQRQLAFRFSSAGVPIGATLTFVKDENKTAKVIDDRTIELDGKVTSLSAGALKLLQAMGYKWKSVAGPQYWLYEGETLSERRARKEEIDDVLEIDDVR
jgi:hypothetical protein